MLDCHLKPIMTRGAGDLGFWRHNTALRPIRSDLHHAEVGGTVLTTRTSKAVMNRKGGVAACFQQSDQSQAANGHPVSTRPAQEHLLPIKRPLSQLHIISAQPVASSDHRITNGAAKQRALLCPDPGCHRETCNVPGLAYATWRLETINRLTSHASLCASDLSRVDAVDELPAACSVDISRRH